MGKKRFGLRMQIVFVTSMLVAFLAGNSINNISKVIQLRNGYQFLLESVLSKKNYLLELNPFDSRDSKGINELRLDFGRMRDLVSASRDKTVRKGLSRDSGLRDPSARPPLSWRRPRICTVRMP